MEAQRENFYPLTSATSPKVSLVRGALVVPKEPDTEDQNLDGLKWPHLKTGFFYRPASTKEIDWSKSVDGGQFI